MTGTEKDNLDVARRYLEAVERGATGDALAAFFTPDVVQEEFPNRVTPNGARRDLATITEAAERGRHVMSRQRYEIVNAVASGPAVALEVKWTGVLSVQFGTLVPGDEMRARFGMFLEFRDGRIARQRNYDCFEPW
ncbi:MAG TPA: nuclear transport factor 2 family protein [Thermoanaerobaculia bacterium]